MARAGREGQHPKRPGERSEGPLLASGEVRSWAYGVPVTTGERKTNEADL